MTPRLHVRPLALAALALAAACDAAVQPPTAPEALELPPPSASFLNGPPEAGVVFRNQVLTVFVTVDEDRGLSSVHLPHDAYYFCGGSQANIGERQFVVTPSQVEQLIVLIKDPDAYVQVFDDTSVPALPDFGALCDYLDSHEPVAEGEVRHTQVLSNTSFTAHWGGELQGADGETLGYSEKYVYLVEPVTGEASIPVSDIHLQGY